MKTTPLLTALLALPLLSSAANAQLANSPWPMYGGNPQHDQWATGIGASPPAIKWSLANINSESGPAIGPQGNIYIGTETGLRMLSPNGTTIWNFNFAEDVYATPAIDKDGTAYIAPHSFSSSNDPSLFAIKSDGTLKWKYTLGGGNRLLASPVIDLSGNIYFTVANGGVYSLRPDGTLRWSVPTGDYYVSSPALSNDESRLYIADISNGIRAINTQTGATAWSKNVQHGVRSSPAIASDGTIYVGTDNNSLLALNPNGSLKWEYFAHGAEPAQRVFSSPAIAQDGTVVFTGDISLYALNPNGSLRWERTNPGFDPASPVIDSLGNIILSAGGALMNFDINGNLRWQLPLAGNQVTRPALGNGVIYYREGEASLTAVIPEPAAITLLLPALSIILRRPIRKTI